MTECYHSDPNTGPLRLDGLDDRVSIELAAQAAGLREAADRLDFERLRRRRTRLLRALGVTRGRVRRKQRALSAELDTVDHALDAVGTAVA